MLKRADSFTRLLSLMAVCAFSAHAQTSLGQVTGRITDSAGAAIPGAQVQARNTATNVVTQASTSTDGLFNILSLVPGTYQVSVEKTGFDKAQVDQVIVMAAQKSTVNAELHVGKVSTTVTVRASASMLNSSSPEVATTIGSDMLQHLPFSEQNSLEAAMLVAGVSGNPTSPGQVDSEIPGTSLAYVMPGGATQVAGGMPGSTTMLVDGANVTQASWGRQAMTVSGNMADEVTVITNGVPAKYGNTGGGVVITATKGGTDEYHGQVSWRHSDPAFNAQPLGNTTRNQNHKNFFGAYAGGPVWIPKLYNGKDKTFFYAGFEPARLFNTTTSAGRLPTPAELAGDFNDSYSFINTTILAQQGLAAALAAPRTGYIYYESPLNAQGFPVGATYANSNQYVPVPNNNLSAQISQNKFAKFVLSQQPTPQNPGPYIQFYRPDGLWLPNGNNAIFISGVKSIDNRYSVRIDHVFSASDRMFFRYSIAPVTSVRFTGYPPDSPMINTPSDQSWAHNFSATETHIITPSMVSELKLMYSRNHQTRQDPPQALTADFPGEYGLTPAVKGAGFPMMLMAGYTLWPGENGALGNIIDVNAQAAEDVTWTKGRHTIAFGADIRRIQSNQDDTSGLYGGSYRFGTGANNSYASFDLGLIQTYTDTPVDIPAYYRWHYYGAYIQDDVKILRNLTLNIGMRYEFQTPRMEVRDNQGTFIPGITGTLNGLPATGAFCFSGSCGLGNSLWPSNYLGFEPRIGIAWAVHSRFTARANYGVMRAPLTGYGNTPLPDFNVASFSVGGNTGGVIPNQPVDYITNPIGPLTSAYTALNGSRGPLFTVQGITVPYIEQTNAVPYIQQWGSTLQFQITPSILLQAGYTGTVGIHLVSANSPPLNFPSLAGLTTLLQQGANFSVTNIPNPYKITQSGAVTNENLLSSLNPYQNFFNQTLSQSFYRGGQSNYHALLVGLTQRVTAGLSLQVSFAWSKTIDDVGGTPAVGAVSIYGTALPQNPFDLGPDRAVSNFGVPARTTIGYSCILPTGRGRFATHNRIIDSIIDGWTTSGIFNAQSGMPFAPLLGNSGYFLSPAGIAALPTGLNLRPNIVPGQPCVNPAWSSDNPFANGFINPNLFSMPGSMGNPAFGDAPRTLTGCRSPRLISLNGSLVKRFYLGHSEKRYAQLQLDAFNAFNHPIFFFNPNSARSLYNAYNTAALTNPTVPPFTLQSNFGLLNQTNSAGMSRTTMVSIRVFF